MHTYTLVAEECDDAAPNDDAASAADAANGHGKPNESSRYAGLCLFSRSYFTYSRPLF